MDNTLFCKQYCVEDGLELKTNPFTSLNQQEKVNIACRIRGMTKPNLASRAEHFLISMCSVPTEGVSKGKREARWVTGQPGPVSFGNTFFQLARRFRRKWGTILARTGPECCYFKHWHLVSSSNLSWNPGDIETGLCSSSMKKIHSSCD